MDKVSRSGPSLKKHSAYSGNRLPYNQVTLIFSETAFKIINDILKPNEQEKIRSFVAQNAHEGEPLNELNGFKLLWKCDRLKKNVAIYYTFGSIDEITGEVTVVVFIMDIEDRATGFVEKTREKAQPLIDELEEQGKIVIAREAIEWLKSWMGGV
jgi:hypothetical protein